jgi:outer membrane receptor for ferrienterochelin and colicin
MNKSVRRGGRYALLTCAVFTWLSLPVCAVDSPQGGDNRVETGDIVVKVNAAKEEAKYESQSTTVITREDIEKKQAKSVEDIIFSEVGVTRTVDAMGNVGVSIRGAEPRHTLIMVDGHPVLGDVAKYRGAGDEVMRLGAENIERIEIIRGAASAKYGADAIGGVINIITKTAGKKPALALNVEGLRAQDGRENTPFSNFFLRADAGTVGRLRLSAWGSKRDVLPIYAAKNVSTSWDSDFRSSLRYFGSIKNVGLQGTYDLGRQQTLRFSLGKEIEDMKKHVKYSNEEEEPEQNLRREIKRDTYDLSYRGRNGKYDWVVDYNYGKRTENDIGILSLAKSTQYTGYNMLFSLNDVEHRQWNLDTKINAAVNDDHLLTFGFGYSDEHGEGSRIQDAPTSYKKKIRPDDYDSNLWHQSVPGTALISPEGKSYVHDYKFNRDASGNVYWDEAYEYRGTADLDNYKEVQASDMLKPNNHITVIDKATGAEIADPLTTLGAGMVYYAYKFGDNPTMPYLARINGFGYKEEYNARQNTLTIGKAQIQKWHAYLMDTWQYDKDTIFTPIVRLDHSTLFGSHVTAGVGMTHNVGGNPHRRFKANVGTGYAEPGMGELYYNWEMYPAMSEHAPGWYWVGNAQLKPEKSVNLSLSLEGETKNTFARVSIFHNRIKDYLTHYFSGHYLYLRMNAPTTPGGIGDPDPSSRDRLYSFRNLGNVAITGLEAELDHAFSRHWSVKLGYTYLHAINKDAEENHMPRELLDRPRHKIDFGIHYMDEKTGWSGSLWADYYLNMLDSNSVDMSKQAEAEHAADYKRKSFGIWNLMVQKKFGKDAMAYIGVDNLFAKRDDDRAFQGRVYRLGMNFAFDSAGGRAAQREDPEDAALLSSFDRSDWFIRRDTETLRPGEFRVSGDYRLRQDSHTGEARSGIRVTDKRDVGDAQKNLEDKPAHGYAQRLRVRADAGLGAHTSATIVAGAAGGMDGQEDISPSRGLNKARIERAELRHEAGAVDVSLGRLEERIGLTGYFFGKDYDGARAVWTGERTQVRAGVGDFSHTTGITDTAYTKLTPMAFLRSATKDELLGWVFEDAEGNTVSDRLILPNLDKMNYHQKFLDAQQQDQAVGGGSIEHRMKVLREFYTLLKEIDPSVTDEHDRFSLHSGLTRKTGGSIGVTMDKFDPTKDLDTYFNSAEYLNEIKNAMKENGGVLYLQDGSYTPVHEADLTPENFRRWFGAYGLSNGDANNLSKRGGYATTIGYMIFNLSALWNPDGTSYLPLSKGPKVIPVPDGQLLMRDTTPAVKTAGYVQVKHLLTDDLGVQAHYMKSLQDSDYGGKIASVYGLGASLRLGAMAKLSYEWGQNSSGFAKGLNGGSTPSYHVLRLDYGTPDSWQKGSWNAFFDYKRFAHGSFLGGNGTESLPDRYIDGIRSFTVGAGYVPIDNLRVDFFYTFDAKGTAKRATLFGSEDFKLGDYARVQATYKF